MYQNLMLNKCACNQKKKENLVAELCPRLNRFFFRPMTQTVEIRGLNFIFSLIRTVPRSLCYCTQNTHTQIEFYVCNAHTQCVYVCNTHCVCILSECFCSSAKKSRETISFRCFISCALLSHSSSKKNDALVRWMMTGI